MVELKIKKLKDNALVPKSAHEGDAGIDLHSTEAHVLEPGQQTLVSTGISMAIPDGHVGLVWDRSGFAAKHSIHTLAGVIDSGYRGEVKVVMINLGKEKFQIDEGMRIAQLLVQPVARPDIKEAEDLEETKRGEGGFGSTGH